MAEFALHLSRVKFDFKSLTTGFTFSTDGFAYLFCIQHGYSGRVVREGFGLYLKEYFGIFGNVLIHVFVEQ